jgi:hypothetical protein
MFETTTRGTRRAPTGGLACASRKGGGVGRARGEDEYPNIIEEPTRVIDVGDRRGQKSDGGKARKGRAADKGARSEKKGAVKKGRG